jgi:hypothetical protein
MAGSGTLDSFGNVLSGLAKRLGLESRLIELRLQHHWHEIVGEPMASHTWPAQIRFKKLYLIVRNSVWLQQLTFLKPTLLTKLQTASGAASITDLAFRVGEIPGETETPPASSATDFESPQSEKFRAELISSTAMIQDPSIRERLREVISRYPAQRPLRPAKGPSQVP